MSMPFNIARWVDDVLSETAGEALSAPVLAKVPVPDSPRTVRKPDHGDRQLQQGATPPEEAQRTEKDPLLKALGEGQDRKRKRSTDAGKSASRRAAKRKRKQSPIKLEDYAPDDVIADLESGAGEDEDEDEDADSYDYSIEDDYEQGDDEYDDDDDDEESYDSEMEAVHEKILETLEAWARMMIPILLKDVEGDEKDAILKALDRL